MTHTNPSRLPVGQAGLDALVEMGLDADTRALMLGARGLVAGEFTFELSRQMEADNAIHPSIIDKLAESGILGALIGEPYGGGELTAKQFCTVVEEISRGDASVGVMLSVSGGLASSAIQMFGTEQQRQSLLPDLASGSRIGSYQLTEEGAGSNPAFSIKSKVERTGSGWKLTGKKMWITNADLSVTGADRLGRKRKKKGIGIVFAVDPELERLPECSGKNRYKSIRALLVDFQNLDAKSVEVIAYENKHGLRSSATGQVQYSNAILPQDALLGGEEPGRGFKVALGLLSSGRLNIAAQSLGIHRAALEACIAYGNEREIAPGAMMGKNDLIRAQLADHLANYLRNRALMLQAAELSRETDASTLAASAKLCSSRDAQMAARYAMDFFGGAGFTVDVVAEQLSRNAAVLTTYEGSSNTLLGILGSSLFGK